MIQPTSIPFGVMCSTHECFPAAVQALEILRSWGQPTEILQGENAIGTEGNISFIVAPLEQKPGRTLRLLPPEDGENPRMYDEDLRQRVSTILWTKRAQSIIVLNEKLIDAKGGFPHEHVVRLRASLDHLCRQCSRNAATRPKAARKSKAEKMLLHRQRKAEQAYMGR